MPSEPERRCLRCDAAAGYNRVVLDLVADTIVGSLCRNCELDHLSDWTESARERSISACHCRGCNRDPHVSFPRWLPETTVSDGVIESTVTYDRAETSLLLCDEHFDALVSCESVPPSTTPAAAEFR
ncbi:hypothetical protein [Halovivax limisalsi]|uniref:hypothetical protein n=1 Tax=Halovivax limisalsi TaxID=1453760 RepID=UPI001FFD9601|nr:hypothetical protein [Halovivax limisalsi]